MIIRGEATFVLFSKRFIVTCPNIAGMEDFTHTDDFTRRMIR